MVKSKISTVAADSKASRARALYHSASIMAFSPIKADQYYMHIPSMYFGGVYLLSVASSILARSSGAQVIPESHNGE